MEGQGLKKKVFTNYIADLERSAGEVIQAYYDRGDKTNMNDSWGVTKEVDNKDYTQPPIQ